MDTELTNQIRAHLSLATEEDVTNGKLWYKKALDECKLIADLTGLELTKVVGVLAALSPRNKWARNIRDTHDLILDSTTKVCTFNSNKNKALDIIKSDGGLRSITDILRGEKTTNFFLNIYHYDSCQSVVVDVWAFRSVGLEPSPKNYKLTEAAYREVAEEMGFVPNQLQAIVWSVVRGSAS